MTLRSRRPMLPKMFLLFAFTAATLAAHAAPKPADHWVGSWATAPMAANNAPMPARLAAPPAVIPPANSTAPVPPATPTPAPVAPAPLPPGTAAAQMPAGGPGGAPGGPPNAAAMARFRMPRIIYGTADTTLREIVHLSIGGPEVRVVFTNEFGTEPLTIGAAHVAVSSGGSGINMVSASGLTFGGRTQVTIPAGAMMVSDPVALKVPAESDLAISFFLPAQTISQVSIHTAADQTSYTAPGNVVGAQTLDSPTEIRSWPFLKGVDVMAPAQAATVVAFGDSITDGAFAANNGNARWPDELARRLVANPKTADIGVLNEGIGGNGVLRQITGPSALSRFDRDVIAQAGVNWVIIMEAINDIGAYGPKNPNAPVPATPPPAPPTAEDLIGGYKQMIERAHMHGIKVYMATLTPYGGAGYMSAEGDAVRVAVNTWIRSQKEADGVIDFDKVTLDPANPNKFLPAFDHGDHLHPSDPGYKAMGDAIDLSLFTK